MFGKALEEASPCLTREECEYVAREPSLAFPDQSELYKSLFASTLTNNGTFHFVDYYKMVPVDAIDN